MTYAREVSVYLYNWCRTPPPCHYLARCCCHLAAAGRWQLRISAIYTQNSDLYLAADSDIYRINQSPSPHNGVNSASYFRRAKSKNQHCPLLKINCYQQSSIHLPIYSNSQMFILNTDIRRKYVCDLVEINHLSGDIDNKSRIT